MLEERNTTQRMQRTIVIGDVHGCIEELKELLEACRVGPTDRVVFAGDLIDRGPDSLSVLAIARQHEGVLGNHDAKGVEWRFKEERQRRTGQKNGMEKPYPERQAQWEAMTDADLAYIRALPVTLYLGENWVVVHGGFEDVPWAKQKEDRMIRVRFVDEVTGLMATRGKDQDPWEQPPGSVPWMVRWRGKNVVYGHAVHSLSKPRVDINGTTECWGIDTGCVFGGTLTALVLPSKEIVQVRAKRQYAKPPTHLAP